MSVEECNKLHQQIIKKINTWPPETVNNTLISNLSNNFSYISNNFSYNLSNISVNFSGSNSIKSNASAAAALAATVAANQTTATTTTNDQTINKSNQLNQNGKLSSSNSLATINSKLSSLSSLSTISNGKQNQQQQQQSQQQPQQQPQQQLTNGYQVHTNGGITANKSPKQSTKTSPLNQLTSLSPQSSSSQDTSSSNGTVNSNTPINSPTHSSQISLSTNNSIIPTNNAKIDEDLIDVICKLFSKCEFLNRLGEKHDYTGKRVNGYFSMLRIIRSFFDYVLNQMDKKKRKIFPDFIEVGNLLLLVLNAMEEYANKYAELRVRYDNGDFNYDLLTDFEDEEDVKKNDHRIQIAKNGVELNISDASSSEDEFDEIQNFDNISSNLVKMSSNLANSIESMKSQCENVFEDLANNNETYDPIIDEDNDACKEKIEDYYRNNELKDNEDDKEYGKEIKKEEYESTLQKYYKRFNFNFKLNKSSSCTSPVNDDGSPKKIIASTLNPNSATINGKEQRPDSPKKNDQNTKGFYKYFSNLKNNFEENLSRLTATDSNFKTISEEQTTNSSPKNGKLTNSSSSNGLKQKDTVPDVDGTFLVEDALDQEEEESDEERRLREAKLDEYILSKFHITNDDLHLVSPPMLYFYEGFTLTLNREKELSLIYGRITPWWYCKSACQIVSLVRNLVVILTSPPSKSIVSLYNTNTSARLFAHRQVNATLDSLLQGLATLEVKAYNRRYFKYLYRGHVIIGKTLRFPVHSEFELPSEGNDLIRHKMSDYINKSTEQLNGQSEKEEKHHMNGKVDSTITQQNDQSNSTSIEEDEKVVLDSGFNSRTVRCRLINYVRSQNETELCEDSHKKILFHVHGGGFVLSSPDSHELYLRDWAVKLKGIPILSVDYTLRQRFPKAPQDVLDVYMFLVDPKNQEKVSEMLGFLPEQFVLAGDSAGANLAFSLICLLNEIRRNNPEYANIRMPTSIVCVYGAFDIRAVMSPSKFICSIDPILHHGNIMAMIGTYAGIAQKIRKTIWSRIKHKRSIAWYRVSERELKARFKTLSKAMESYFASPLTYPRLDDLKDISLHLVSTHFCPLIDDSVVLYKAWRGASTFDIFDGLPHAFLNFSDRSEEAKIATDKVAERLIQAFIKKKSSSSSSSTTVSQLSNDIKAKL